MKFKEVELPSNQKFGYFFTAIFLVVSIYLWTESLVTFSYVFAFLGISLLIVSIFRADTLLPFNKIWMKFGLMLGIIISPITLGVIFFGLFTPISLTMRLFGRDELQLRFNKKNTYWIVRDTTNLQPESFKRQF